MLGACQNWSGAVRISLIVDIVGPIISHSLGCQDQFKYIFFF